MPRFSATLRYIIPLVGSLALLSTGIASETLVPCFAQGARPDGQTRAPVGDWRALAEASRPERVEGSFAAATKSGFPGLLLKYFARLWTETDVPETNQELIDILGSQDPKVRREYALDDKWDLWLAPFLYRTYFTFGSRARGERAGRLTPELEAVILEALWKLSKDKNDFALTTKSTWWMTGSENHDLNSKVTALLTSQIFRNLDGYRERTYPDAGNGPGQAYWFHSMYGETTDQGPPGGGDYADGQTRGPAEHYAAWVGFFKEYIRERARRGFFVEVAASGYMKFTISYILDLRDYCEDPEVRDLAGKFLDAIWADWAIDQINGHRGGARTRYVDGATQDSMYLAGKFLLGGESSAQLAGHAWYGLLTSDYALPPIVWTLALDREGMGSFAFESRRPGEESAKTAWERPAGFERSLLCDTDSRFIRYSYITPDYILGTQMDHPGAIHSHLSVSNRWQGMMFADDDVSRVYPTGFTTDDAGKYVIDKSAYFRSVQSGSALITQLARRFTQANPEWFPSYDPKPARSSVWFGKLGETAVESEGWIFVETERAWLAVRPLDTAESTRHLVRGGPKDSAVAAPAPDPDPTPSTAATPYTSDPAAGGYAWTEDRRAITLKNPYSPVLFQAGTRTAFPTLDDFRQHVLSGSVALRKIVVEGYFHVRWETRAPEAVTLDFPAANEQMPKINGRWVNYSPEWLFRSPFLNSKFGSGILSITHGDANLVLDFNATPTP